MSNQKCQRYWCDNDATTICSGPLPGEKNAACDEHKVGCGVTPIIAMFGQQPCSNCGFLGLPCAEKSDVKFVNGDAVCPECGEVCDYFDHRDC